MSILIKRGRVITAADDYVGDVYVEDERISLIGLLEPAKTFCGAVPAPQKPSR